MIYLDNSATTKVIPEVVDVMSDVMNNIYGNPSSLHGIGQKAERLIEAARKVIATELKVQNQEIIFTSGGTEANNLAIKGIVESYSHRGKHLITTKIEHPSVLDVFQYLENKGWKVTYLSVNEQGLVNPQELEQALTPETILASIMHVNNETGAIQPIEEIGRILAQFPRTLFHVDAVQSFTKLPLYPKEHHIDLLSISSHKIHGPKGIGALYRRKNLLLAPQIIGGGQENGIRSGTYNVPGIAGFAKAVAWSRQQREKLLPSFKAWKQEFSELISQHFPFVRLNSPLSYSAPYIINLSFPGLKSEVIVLSLEAERCYISSRSACSSKLEKPSHVLLAMGLPAEVAVSSIRISMGYLSEKSDLQGLFQQFVNIIPQLQKVMKVQK